MTRELCKACGRVSPIGFQVPVEVWVAATESFPGVLCILCFAARADDAGVEWDKEIEFYPISLRSHRRLVTSIAPLSASTGIRCTTRRWWAFGKRVRELRTAKRWTQEQLAEAAGMNWLQVGHIERGASDPKLSTITKLAKALGVSRSDLVR